MTVKQIADEIAKELSRLGISTDDDPCSGLMVRVTEGCLVIYDDHANGVYGEAVLAFLKALEPNDVSLGETNNVWQLIQEFEA